MADNKIEAEVYIYAAVIYAIIESRPDLPGEERWALADMIVAVLRERGLGGLGRGRRKSMADSKIEAVVYIYGAVIYAIIKGRPDLPGEERMALSDMIVAVLRERGLT